MFIMLVPLGALWLGWVCCGDYGHNNGSVVETVAMMIVMLCSYGYNDGSVV